MLASPITFTHDVTERFLRYVVIDTQSDPTSPTCPSTEKQKNLGRLLAAELRAMERAVSFSENRIMPTPSSSPLARSAVRC